MVAKNILASEVSNLVMLQVYNPLPQIHLKCDRGSLVLNHQVCEERIYNTLCNLLYRYEPNIGIEILTNL